MDLANLLFGFQGRINRAQYWLGGIGAGAGAAVLIFCIALITAPAPDLPKGAGGEMRVMAAVLFGLVMVGLMWCALALQVKRFHDRGKSGYWSAVAFAPATMITLTLASGIAADAPASEVVPQILPWFGVSGLINLWLFVELGLLSGVSGPNKYDHTPQGGAGLPSFAKESQPASAAFLLGGAQNAMDRAIEAQAAQTMAAARAHTPRPNPGGFGQRPAR